MRSFSRVRLGAVTSATMAVATFPLVIWGVLAAELISEFSISRAQLGILATATALVGALLSPTMGRVTDRLGSLASVRAALVVGSIALVAIAVSPTYALLLGAALLTAVPNAWGNPSTNTLIVDMVPPGSRGLVTGVKQSGVQVGAFLGGIFLPMLAAAFDWRVAVVAFVVIPLAGLAGTIGKRAVDGSMTVASPRDGQLPRTIYWIALYGSISGLGTAAVWAFIPLFAEEDQLWSAQAAGLLFAVMGLTGFFARIAWPAFSERSIGHGRALRIQALLSTVAGLLLALAAMGTAASWVMVPAVMLVGLGSISWNAVGMLAVMDESPPGLVGKGTGVVLFGFLLGTGLGPPLMGLSIDAFDSYVPGWFAVVVLMIVSAAVAGKIPAGSTLQRA